MLVVLVERHCPRSLLRCRVDPHLADEVDHGGQQLSCHVGDGAIGGQRDAVRSTVGVVGHGVVAVQVQRDDQCAGAVWRRQWQGLPPAPAQAQRGVLQLWLRRASIAASLPRTCVWACTVSQVALQPSYGSGNHPDVTEAILTTI